VFWRRKREQDLDRELRSHLDLETEEQGDPYAARRAFGNLTRVKEDVRAAWGWMWLERLAQDLRYALRTTRQSPGFTATAVLSLALGIGANTAIFSLIDAVMLRWLPVPNPQELVLLKLQQKDGKGPTESFSYVIVRALSDQKETFARVGGFSTASFEVGSPGSINRVSGAWVTGGFYETLGLNASVGRLLSQADDESGAPLVAVISDGYWERQYARNSGILGQSLPINGVPVIIIGVTPPGFVGASVGSVADITMPVAALPRVNPEAAPLLGSGNFWLRILARPKTGLSIPETEARLASLWPPISEQVIPPTWPAARRKGMAEAFFTLTPGATGYTRLREMFRRPLLVLMAVVALVLLIACLNVANLLLVRAAARQREIAVRLAIGAARNRVIRQLLTESMLLSSLGAVFGIALGWPTSRFLVNLFSTGPVPVSFDLTPNWHVLAFTSAVAVVTTILFGLAPALQTTAAGPSPALKDGGRVSRSRSRLPSSLVCIQVALSLLLLIGAGLFVRTLRNLQSLDFGFKREGVLLVNLDRHQTAFPQRLLDDVRRVPGVISASISTHTPLSGSTWTDPVIPKGQAMPEHDTAIFAGIGPGFFETMGTPLLSGRGFVEGDAGSKPSVAVVSESFVARYLPGRNPVGQYLTASIAGSGPTDLEIVGVAKNVISSGLRRAPYPAVYVPYAQLTGDPRPGSKFAQPVSTLEIRAGGPLGQVAEEVRHALQAKLPNTSVEVRGLSAQVDAAMVQERMMATLAGGFGALALLLACVGLYGLLAYGVARRTREMGIRMALGARRRGVIGLIVAGAIRVVMAGIVLGVPTAWVASRWVESMLFGLRSTDPATIGGAAGVLTVAALLAAYLPARRASRIDPMSALRHE